MSEQHGNVPAIDRANGRKWGYNVDQVDGFLAHARGRYSQAEPDLTQDEIQTATFDLEKGGYSIPQVDSALVRLEKAVVDKRTQWDVEHRGVRAWMADTRAAAETLRQRAEAHRGERFTPAKKKQAAYDKRQVDQLVDDAWHRIASAARLETSANPQDARDVEATEVSNAVFTQRTGDKGYREDSVDAYLNRVVQVLTRLESVNRLGIVVPWSEESALPATATVVAPAVASGKTSTAKDRSRPFESRAVESSPIRVERTESEPVRKRASVRPVSAAETTSVTPPEAPAAAKAPLSGAADEPKSAVMPVVIPPAPQAVKEPLATARYSDGFVRSEREEPQESAAKPVERLSATAAASRTADAAGTTVFPRDVRSAFSPAEPESAAPDWSSDSWTSQSSEMSDGEADRPVSLTYLIAQSRDHEMPQPHPRHSLDSLPEEGAARSAAGSADSGSVDAGPSKTPEPIDPDQFFSRLMESSIMPTGSFDIPDLTFPEASGGDSQK